MQAVTEADKQLVADLEQKALAYTEALIKLLSQASDKLVVAYLIIEQVGVKTDATWDYIQNLGLEERQKLLPEFLEAAGIWNYPCMGRAQEQILRLPKMWLLENLETAIQPLLEQDPQEAYALLIDLYTELDFPKALDWARVAAKHENDRLKHYAQKWLSEHEH